MSIALSYIFKKHIKISKIRANRPRGGGLANQHLTGLQAIVSMLPGCSVTGNHKGSTEVEFNPK
jgi:RNA 3'-terminal phosphate cyclase